MDVVNSISIGEDNAAHRLLVAAEQLLAARSGNAEAAFVGKLYSGAAPEDVTQYSAVELADLAAETLQWIVERALHTPKIRLYSPSSGATAQTISVLEIVNDDMPFLLNSVLGELSENGLEPLLVVHPIIGVKRDAAGRLIAWSAELGGDGGWKRESVIHIHVARLDDETRRAAIARGAR